MVHQFQRKKSKRMTCRKKYKIERKVKEHNKKLRRDAKKSGKGKAKKKDPGVPNSLPFKEDILREAEQRKQRLEEEREKQKARAKKQRAKLQDKKRDLGSLVKDAQKRTEDFNKKNAFVEEKSKEYTGGKSVENSLKAYYKEFRKVVDNADVVLQVLDARDPLGSRCPQVEEAVLSAGAKKRLVLVLNKIDLIPKENAEAWLKYLRNEFPAIAFKASTQSQAENLGQVKKPIADMKSDMLKSSRCLGADTLMKLLGNYSRNANFKQSITVGVVGFPNTGKSSIINSLKRSKACSVGATPGVTKQMQEVQLDKHVKLLDSPGIVMATNNTDASTILRNCVKVETVEDPVTPVAAILKRCSKPQIMMHYNITDFSDVHEFLALLAKRFGRLKKGGVPDTHKAGKTVLQDWNHGRITYYTHPPEAHNMPTHLSADIVTQMAKEFDIDALLDEEQNTLDKLKQVSTTDIIMESSGPTDGLTEDGPEAEAEMQGDGDDEDEWQDEDEEEKMEDDEAGEELKKVTVSSKRKALKSRNKAAAILKPKPKVDKEALLAGNMQIGKEKRKELKKMKKQKRKADTVAGKLSDALENAFGGMGSSGNENYNFDVHFK